MRPSGETIRLDSAAAQLRPRQAAESFLLPLEISNAVEMKIRLIPAGEFLIVAAEDDPDASPQEKQEVARLTKPF